jgi:hypothetical protein
LVHRLVGRRCCAAGLADPQVSPTNLTFVPMLIETAIMRTKSRSQTGAPLCQRIKHHRKSGQKLTRSRASTVRLRAMSL